MTSAAQPTSFRLPKDLKAFLKKDAEKNQRLLTHHMIWILQYYRQAVEKQK